MFKTCYSNEVQTVGIAGPSASIVSSFWSDETKAVIIVDESWRTTTTTTTTATTTTAGRAIQETPYKLQNFVITTSSTTSLKKTLEVVKNTAWWNHMASFLIIDSPTALKDNGCFESSEILSTAWKMDILRATFICQHESKGPLIYSYNPYTNQAPLPWQVEKTYRITNKHPWTLLVRPYQESEEICKDLDFDKTKDLGGYEIQGSFYSSDIADGHSSEINLESVMAFSGTYARYLFHALNSTVKLFVYETSIEISDMIRLGADIHLSVWYQQNDFNCSMTYPYGVSGMVAVTQYRGQLSQIEKLLRVIDYASKLAVVTVGFVTFIFFKFFFRQSVTSAFMNIVRLICNAALPNLPSDVTTRIYLTGLFIFMVTLQAIYQGQLASLLTKQVALPNVDMPEDLANYKYTIYGHKTLIRYFKNYDKPIVSVEHFNCEEYAFRDADAVCVKDRVYAVDISAKLNLHVSKYIWIKMFIAYLIRDDWPLEERLNTLISRLYEAYILDYLREEGPGSTESKLKYYEKERSSQKFQVIELQELAFAFAILGIGLAFSTVVFIVEVIMEYGDGGRMGQRRRRNITG